MSEVPLEGPATQVKGRFEEIYASSRRPSTAAAIIGLGLAAVLAGCTGDANGSPSTATPPPATTSSAPPATTSSSSTTASPTEEEQAEAGVVAFYEELDAVAAGKARLDSFKHAATNGEGTGESTLDKWQGILSNQLADGYKQTGKTHVRDLSTKSTKDVEGSHAWLVTACVDRSDVVLKDSSGNVVEDAGSPDRIAVQHTVIDDLFFQVLYDKQGKSC
jgi:hypothetical protein